MTDSVSRSGFVPEPFPGGKDRKRRGMETASLIQVQNATAVTREAASFGFGATA